jgi:hypothetical protein
MEIKGIGILFFLLLGGSEALVLCAERWRIHIHILIHILIRSTSGIEFNLVMDLVVRKFCAAPATPKDDYEGEEQDTEQLQHTSMELDPHQIIEGLTIEVDGKRRVQRVQQLAAKRKVKRPTILLGRLSLHELQNSWPEGWTKELRSTLRIRRNLRTLHQNPCYLGERHGASGISVGSYGI